MNSVFVVYYTDPITKTDMYCVSSGSMTFTKNIYHAYHYNNDSAKSIANYLNRANRFKDCEVGIIEIKLSLGLKKPFSK